MKLINIFASSLIFVSLIAASCGPGPTPDAQLTELAITRTIGINNEATSATDLIPASAKSIYLSGRVLQPKSSTRIKVVWSKLSGGIVGTESFSGTASRDQFDFDRSISGSYFASQVDRTGVTWEQGAYKADVYVGSKLYDSLSYKVVSDTEADISQNKKILSSVSFGSELDDAGGLANSQTTFSRSTPHIYIDLSLAGTNAGNKIETSVRYLKGDQVINTFTTTTGRDTDVIFDLSLSQFGRLWTDKLWPSGGFEVLTKINGTVVSTQSFIVN